MNGYDDLVAGKSLDKLLKEANEEKNSLCKRETELVFMEKRGIEKVDFLLETETGRLLDYFNLCMPFKTVYSHLRKLQDIDINPSTLLSNKLLISGDDIKYGAERYTSHMENLDFKRGFVIGDKVVTVYSEEPNFKKEYFYDRSRAFPFGSIGEICSIDLINGLYVRFFLPPKSDWPKESEINGADGKWIPTDEKWKTIDGANDNASYRSGELQFVPLNSIEGKMIMYETDTLAKKIDNLGRGK